MTTSSDRSPRTQVRPAPSTAPAAPSARRQLQCVAASVPAARRFVAEELVGAPAEVEEIATLLVSELATNCVIHAGTRFDVAVTVTAHEVRVDVTDYGPGQPAIASPPPTNPHGRGLRFVDALASAWGSDAAPSGAKTTWFVLSVPTVAPLPRSG